MKNWFYLVLCTILLGSCISRNFTAEEAEKVVLEGEKERLAYVTQEFEDVESIVIDSIHIRVTEAPMSGFLYTTWKYVVKTSYYPERTKEVEKSIIVAVDDIRDCKSNKGYIEWHTDWDGAYRVVLQDMY